MRTMLGIAIAHDRVRAVALRAGSVAWAAEVEVDSPDRMADAVAELLSAVPFRRMRRPPVALAIGPACAQTRVIGGLPPLKDVRVLSRMVREGSGRFFLRNGIPLLTSGVRVIEPGRVWAAAFDEPVVDAVLAGCRATRFRVRGVAPSVAVLGAALEGDCIVWADGPVHAEVEFANGDIVAVRRWPQPTEEGVEPLRPREALAKLGDRAWRFADAYGAAVCAADLPLALRPGRAVAGPAVAPHWRLAAAATAAAAAAAAALTGPGLVAQRSARESAARLAELAEARNAAIVAEAQLERFNTVLDEVAAFDAERRSITLLLAEITRALPDGNALVAFRVDSAGGTVVAVSPRAAGVVAALEKVPGIASPRIVGPVTRERVGARELERITVRFLLAGGDRMGSEPRKREGTG